MKVLIVDDDKLVSTSLKTILESDIEITVVGIGNNGNEGITLYKKLNPDIVLIDIRMTPLSGLEAAEIILKENQSAKILFLTTFADDEYIIKALKIGAKGYILKQNFESITPAIKAVYSGQTVFGEDIMSKVPTLFNTIAELDFEKFGLTEKEYKIIKLISEGFSNKEIGSILFLSDGTIRNTISVILEKLSLRDRTQIAIFYYKNV